MLSIAIGVIDTHILSPKPLPRTLEGKDCYYQGTITAIVEKENSTAIDLDINGIGDSPTNLSECRDFQCRTTVPSTSVSLSVDDRVVIYTRMEQPRNRVLPDAFDYRRHLYNRGITATAFIPSGDIIVVGHESSVRHEIRAVGTRLGQHLFDSSLSSETARFLNAIIIGDTSDLSDEQRLEYSSAGIAHILALSGLHVAIVAWVLNILLFPLYMSRKKALRYGIIIVLLWGYAFMTGMSPSVTRAVIMTSIYLTAMMLQRRYSAINAVCIAAIAILMFDPLQLYNVGFQLSFVAVISIILLANRLNPVPRRKGILHYVMSIPAASTAAMIGTGIVSVYYFHSFPVYFLIANIVTSILLPVLIGGGIMVIILEAFGADFHPLCHVLDMVYNALDTVTTWMNALPGSSIDHIFIPGWILVPYFLGLSAFFMLPLSRRKLPLSLAGSICLIATVALIGLTRPTYPDREILIPPTPQYTNIIIRDRHEARMLTTAPSHDAAHQVELCQQMLRTYLDRRGCDSLKLLGADMGKAPIKKLSKDILRISDKTFLIASDTIDALQPNHHIDYLLISRAFHGNIDTILANLKPDTAILCYDIHPATHKKHASQCRKWSIPIKSVKYDERPFIIAVP